jgi:uncharacterized protein
VTAAVLASFFVVGLLGGVHCIGMCGGVVTALTVRYPNERPRRRPDLHFAYHAGRLCMYALAGAAAGGLGSSMLRLEPVFPVQATLYLVAQLMLIALGLYLLGIARYLQAFENAGRRLWRHVQPFAAALLPARTLPRAYALGLLWGLLPCGLVYSILATALVSGSALAGALLMLAFGLGTLPVLLALGAVFPALERLRQAAVVRRAAGGIIIGFGLLGLAHAGQAEKPLLFLVSML